MAWTPARSGTLSVRGVEQLPGDSDDRDPDEDEQLVAAHHALYATYFERLPALDAAGDLRRTPAGRGWGIVRATSASGAELTAPRRAIGADDVLLGAAGADDVADGKPAPDPVRQAREFAGVPSERAVFVGDTVWDMEAALRDGVTPVAVLSGGIPPADLETAGAQAVYRDSADLLESLDSRSVNVWAYMASSCFCVTARWAETSSTWTVWSSYRKKSSTGQRPERSASSGMMPMLTEGSAITLSR